MIALVDRADGCVVPVHAQPGARRNAIVGAHGDALKIAVTAPADQGKANAAILEVLARELGLKNAQVELISGQTGRAKRILVRNMTAAEVRLRLEKSIC